MGLIIVEVVDKKKSWAAIFESGHALDGNGGQKRKKIQQSCPQVTKITTRDAIDSRYTKYGHDFTIVDTAGIRKKNKVNEDIEYYSVLRAIRAIENSDVVILLIDATRGFETQDQKIFDLILKN